MTVLMCVHVEFPFNIQIIREAINESNYQRYLGTQQLFTQLSPATAQKAKQHNTDRTNLAIKCVPTI